MKKNAICFIITCDKPFLDESECF